MKTIEKQVGDYLAYCEKVRRMTEATLSAKRNVLERFVRVTGLQDVRGLTNETFNKWASEEVTRGVAPSSVNIYNSVVVAMVRYYQGIGMRVPLNLTLVGKLKEGRTQRKFYTAEEIAVVVANADEVTGLMIRVLFETGMRIAELVKLRVSDIDGRCVRFIGKGRKPREVYLRPETLSLLERYVKWSGVWNYLWAYSEYGLALNGEPPAVHTVRLRLRKAFDNAGFDGFYPHALRHSFATDLQLRGASVAEIKEMIGHSSVATTERYLHGFEGRLKELFDKYR
ncbi:tyrosine-type recombinase/integrase [Candidatus Saccharibacteria bacterium]|nr:tyrosine-type recombinase/integrase [Candidatus Saccharibacteria bacterium]MBR2803020.1 tyrosine-type recombinase/integrase [Candidatus Saccharibacteria bacterium]